MKKLIVIILCYLMTLTLVACSEQTTITVNAENKDNLSGNVFGRSALVEIGDYLWCDSTTRIVYWWNGRIGGNVATTPTPYYAPNGLPYRYNPETNTFEEIDRQYYEQATYTGDK